MTSTIQKFAWKDRDTAARDLVELAYRAPYFVRERALELIEAIGSSQAIVPELEALALDEGFPISERRYAVRAIASAPGDLYLPNFARYNAFNWETSYYQLDFGEVSRLSCHHPSNHDWLFREIENQGAKTYLQALKTTASYHVEAGWNPIFIQHFLDFLKQNLVLLDLELVQLLYNSENNLARGWLTEHLETIIYLCLVDKVGDYIELLQAWPELTVALLNNCPALEPEVQREIRWQEVGRQWDIEHQISYCEFPTWQQLYHLYLQAKENKAALKRLALEATYNTQIPVRAASTFFIGLLQQRYPESTEILCSLLRVPDSWGKDGSRAPVREEAVLALRNTPTPQVWEALIDGFFRYATTRLDLAFFSSIRYITDVLSGTQSLSVAIGDTEPVIFYGRANASWLSKLSHTHLLHLPDK